MRRRRNKNSERRRRIISIVILVIMVVGFTLAGVIMRNPTGQQQQDTPQGGPSSIQYNGYEFTRDGNKYTAEIQGEDRTFYFPPTSTLGIQSTGGWESLLRDGFTVTFDPQRSDVQGAEIARYELSTHLSRVGSGVTRPSDQYQASVVTCDDATQERPVVYLNRSNSTGISVSGGCVIVNGAEEETIRATERLIYTLLGVVE